MIQLNHEPWCRCGGCGASHFAGVYSKMFDKHPEDYTRYDRFWLNLNEQEIIDLKKSLNIQCQN